MISRVVVAILLSVSLVVGSDADAEMDAGKDPAGNIKRATFPAVAIGCMNRHSMRWTGHLNDLGLFPEDTVKIRLTNTSKRTCGTEQEDLEAVRTFKSKNFTGIAPARQF